MAIGIKEQLRLAALHSYHQLDTLPEPRFTDMVRELARTAVVPTSLISLIDTDRQWFKARVGLSLSQTDRTISFCTHAVEGDEPFFIVPDAREDERFANNPLVTAAPHIRFYAGRVLRSPLGQNLGTINIIDSRPRMEVSESVRAMMTAFSERIVAIFEQHRADRIVAEARRTAALTKQDPRQGEARVATGM